jgi:hypothetical protein
MSIAILFNLTIRGMDDGLLKVVNHINLKLEPVAFFILYPSVTSRSPFTCILNFKIKFNLEMNQKEVVTFQGMVYFSCVYTVSDFLSPGKWKQLIYTKCQNKLIVLNVVGTQMPFFEYTFLEYLKTHQLYLEIIIR